MRLAKVTGNLWATKKSEALIDYKLLTVELIDNLRQPCEEAEILIAADTLGAGKGEIVLLSRGSSARVGEVNREIPIDATIIAIVDEKKE